MGRDGQCDGQREEQKFLHVGSFLQKKSPASAERVYADGMSQMKATLTVEDAGGRKVSIDLEQVELELNYDIAKHYIGGQTISAHTGWMTVKLRGYAPGTANDMHETVALLPAALVETVIP
jgi:hypothetical protein